MELAFTPKAKKIWEAIASDTRIRLLNNVWCRHCGKMSSIGNLSGKVESGPNIEERAKQRRIFNAEHRSKIS
jgi:hypothetical protein